MKPLLILAAFSVAAFAADVHVWSASELKGFDKKLGDKLAGKPFNSEQLGKLSNNASAMVAHRESEGGAEVHNTQNDIFIVETGEATLVTGGETPDAKETEPNELRGTSIKGGKQHKLSAGDIVFIPAKTPHQLLVPKGKHFTYVVFKVNE